MSKKSERELAIEALQRLSRDRPHPNDLWSKIIDAHESVLLEEIKSGKAQGALTTALLKLAETKEMADASFAIILAATIEQALELAICTHFVIDDDAALRMFDDNAHGPLSTFAAKIKMAYALGICSKKMRKELDLIRHIRNAFAHSKEKLTFASGTIANACAQLEIPDLPDAKMDDDKPTPKVRYLQAIRYLYVYLEWAPESGPMSLSVHPMSQSLFREF